MAGNITRGRPLDNGKPTYRARYKMADGRSHERSFHTKVMAQEFLNQQTAAIVGGVHVSPRAQKTTFATVATGWKSVHVGDLDPITGVRDKTTLKPSTARGYDQILRTHLIPHWGAMPLKNITTASVRRWLKDLTSGGMSAATVHRVYRVFSMVLGYAVEDAMLAKNPALGVALPQVPVIEPRILNRVEVERLADNAGSEADIVRFLAYLGVRMGELAGLQVENVDFDAGTVRIMHNLVEVGGNLYLGSPKSGQCRTLPLLPSLSDALQSRCADKGPHDYVFTAPRGGPLRQRAFRLRFDRYADDAGFTDIHPHLLRHSFASLAIQAGANVKALQTLMGHLTPSMTARYTHLFPGDLDSIMVRLDAVAGSHAPLSLVPSVETVEPVASGDEGAVAVGN